MELIDLYDGSRVRTGRTAERGSAVRPGENCLVSHLCLFNGRGELLVQRRSVYKDRYPGCWDVSAGGFVRSGVRVQPVWVWHACRRFLPHLRLSRYPVCGDAVSQLEKRKEKIRA